MLREQVGKDKDLNSSLGRIAGMVADNNLLTTWEPLEIPKSTMEFIWYIKKNEINLKI